MHASAAAPPLPPLETLIIPAHGPTSASVPSYTLHPSIIVFISVVAFVILASGILLLLSYLSRRNEARNHIISSPAPAPPPPLNPERKSLIDSLPLFTLGDSPSLVPNSSDDCVVCLSPIRSDQVLRLLPDCRHAFHSPCIDTWLASTTSCPLCRSSVSFPTPPPPSTSEYRSDSFPIDIDSVSRSRASISADDASAAAPPPPGADVADASGDGASSWLQDYVDSLVSSSSSSSSFRHSGRRSHRYDAEDAAAAAAESAYGGDWQWWYSGDTEVQQQQEEDEGFFSFRWLFGA